jgi:hypothetical protein
LAGQPVSHERISDDDLTTPKNRPAINEMCVLISAHMETDFSARIVPGAKGLDSTSGLIDIASMFYPYGVLAWCQATSQHNLARQ